VRLSVQLRQRRGLDLADAFAAHAGLGGEAVAGAPVRRDGAEDGISRALPQQAASPSLVLRRDQVLAFRVVSARS
jgi:hypothetical protein